MYFYEKEKFLIELQEKLYCFYKKNNNIYLAKYEHYNITEERIIIDNCGTLSSVILSRDNSISIIYINLKGELFLSTFIEDKIVNSIVLTRAVSKNNNIQIALVNNALNIFYINEVNTINTLCFRVLSNTLTLTPAVVIDGIDVKGEIPYIISASDNSLAVCYVKIGYPNSIGYRIFDVKRNSWSSFKELDSCAYKIENINFTAKEDIIAYSYTFIKNKKANVVCGIGKENIKNNIIEEVEPSINLIDISISEDNKLNIIYLLGDVIKIKELEVNREIRFVDDIKLKNITEAKKYNFSCDKKISKNSILIIKSEEINVFTDSTFIQRISIEKYRENIELPKYLTNSFISDKEVNEKIESLNINTDSLDNDLLKTFITRINGYENTINKLTEKFMVSDEEKKKLLENINYLNDQLSKKNYKINSFESVLTERQNLINTYENRIKELSNLLESNNQKQLDFEIRNLKDIINKNEIEKSNYINEIKNNESKINELRNNLSNKTIEANNMILENEKIKEKSRVDISRLNEIINNINMEKESYINDIKVLKDQIQELNNIISNNNNSINILQEQLEILQDKNNNDSFIKKLFKSGE